jgi:hypothetical protein
MAMKSPYRQKLDARVKEWDARLEVVEARARRVGTDFRIAYAERLERLREREHVVQGRLRHLAEEGQGAWRTVKGRVVKAACGLKEAVEEAVDEARERRG